MNPIFKPAQYLEWPGFVLVVIGAMLFALFMVNNKRMIKNGVPPDALTTCNTLLAGSMFFIASFVFNPPKIWSVFDLRIGIFWPLFATCILNIFVQFGAMRAQKYADTTLVAAVGAFQPFISLLPSWLILGETPSDSGYFGFVLIASGIYITSLAQKIKDPSKVPAWGKTAEGNLRFTAPLAALFTSKGVQLAFFATACGAISVNFDKKSAILSSFLFAPAVIFIFVGLVGLIRVKRSDWQKIGKEYYGWILASATLQFSANVLFWRAFQYGLAIYISSFKRLNTIFVLPLSYFILKEDATREKKYWLGIFIFVAGLLFFTIPN